MLAAYGAMRKTGRSDEQASAFVTKLFGGWTKANTVWFDRSNGRMLEIERAVGGPSS